MRKQSVANTPPTLRSIYEGWERTDGSFRPDHKARRRIRTGTKWTASKSPQEFAPEELQAFYAEHRGDFIVLPIERELYGFGRVIDGATMGFYDLLSPTIPSIDEIDRHRILFIVNIPYEPLFSGRWRVLGRKPLPGSLRFPVKFYRHVYGSDFIEIYVGMYGRPQPYGGEDLTTMESVNGWSAWTVEERLRSHCARRPDLTYEWGKIPADVAKRLRREYFERHAEAKKEA